MGKHTNKHFSMEHLRLWLGMKESMIFLLRVELEGPGKTLARDLNGPGQNFGPGMDFGPFNLAS